MVKSMLEGLSTQKLIPLGWRGNCLFPNEEFVSDGHILIPKPLIKWKLLEKKTNNETAPVLSVVQSTWQRYLTKAIKLNIKLPKNQNINNLPYLEFAAELNPQVIIKLDKFKYLILYKHFGEMEIYGTAPDQPVAFWINSEPVAIMMPIYIPERNP